MIHLRLAPVLYFLFTPVSMAEVLLRFLWLFLSPELYFPSEPPQQAPEPLFYKYCHPYRIFEIFYVLALKKNSI